MPFFTCCFFLSCLILNAVILRFYLFLLVILSFSDFFSISVTRCSYPPREPLSHPELTWTLVLHKSIRQHRLSKFQSLCLLPLCVGRQSLFDAAVLSVQNQSHNRSRPTRMEAVLVNLWGAIMQDCILRISTGTQMGAAFTSAAMFVKCQAGHWKWAYAVLAPQSRL